jgi:hypothetical protein
LKPSAISTTAQLKDQLEKSISAGCWKVARFRISGFRPKRPAPSTMYGTTLRIFDPDIGGWHIIWSDPLNQDYSRQIGRADGKDIVQIGDDSRGLKARWRFTEITTDSFHWIGEERSSNSDPWQVTYEHFARRTDPSYFVGTESGTPALRALWSFCMDWQAGLHISGELMFDHVKFGASDYSASKAFFLKALEPLV